MEDWIGFSTLNIGLKWRFKWFAKEASKYTAARNFYCKIEDWKDSLLSVSYSVMLFWVFWKIIWKWVYDKRQRSVWLEKEMRIWWLGGKILSLNFCNLTNKSSFRFLKNYCSFTVRIKTKIVQNTWCYVNCSAAVLKIWKYEKVLPLRNVYCSYWENENKAYFPTRNHAQ